MRIGGSEEVLFGEGMASKYYARVLATVGDNLYGTSPLEASQIDVFAALAEGRIATAPLVDTVAQLNTHLTLRTFLVGHALSLADLLVWSALLRHAGWAAWRTQEAAAATAPHLLRWFATVDALPACRAANPSKEEEAAKAAEKAKKGAGGSFDVGIEKKTMMGKVVTRYAVIINTASTFRSF